MPASVSVDVEISILSGKHLYRERSHSVIPTERERAAAEPALSGAQRVAQEKTNALNNLLDEPYSLRGLIPSASQRGAIPRLRS
jgi:hypothetical protein